MPTMRRHQHLPRIATVACALTLTAPWCTLATAQTGTSGGTAPSPASPAAPIAPGSPDAPAVPAAVAPAAAPRAPVPPNPVTAPQSAPDLLSMAWMQFIMRAISDPDITGDGLECALELAQECATLSPDRASPWRLTMYLADQLETARPQVALSARRAAMANLARIEPLNDSITLARLTDAVESHGTAEERVRAYETLLDERNASRLGVAVRSRLAYQLAMLQNRMGNTDLFARWLGESVKFDPANPEATMAAAGFFRTRLNDPAADVELLSAAVQANPRDLQAWSALITVLLDHAAFKGAERAARDALAVAIGDQHWASINNLTCDLATALWGQGRREEAQRELTQRLRTITEDYRRRLQFTDPTLTAERIRNMFPPLPPDLSICMLALAQGHVDADSFERMVQQALAMSPQDEEMVRTQGALAFLDGLLAKATVSLLFRKDPSEVAGLLKDIEKAEALPPAALDRFKGMLAWRAGKFDEAAALLAPLKDEDPLAQYAYASTLAATGRPADAAREFRALAASRVGTTLSLVALEQLSVILKQDGLLTVQLDPALAARAVALDQALTTHLSPLVDDLTRRPDRALSISVEPEPANPMPYSRVVYRLRIRNLSRVALAIGRDDPIISLIGFRATAPAAGQVGVAPLPPVTVPFDPALQLPAGGQIDFVMDASVTPLGLALALNPIDSRVISPAIVINPRTGALGPMPAFLGMVTQITPYLVSGVTVSSAWVQDSVAAMQGTPSVDMAYRMVLLAHAAANPELMPEEAREALLSPSVWQAMVTAWGRLDEVEKAWVAASLPGDTPALAPLLDAVRSSPEPKVIASWLLARSIEADDPMFDVARRTGNERLVRLADALHWTADRRAKRKIEDLGVGGVGGGAGGGAGGAGGAPMPGARP